MPATVSKSDIRDVFIGAYKFGCKGITVYRSGTRDDILTSLDDDDEDFPIKRPFQVSGDTWKIQYQPEKTLYLTANKINGRLFEVFLNTNNSRDLPWAQILARLITAIVKNTPEHEFLIEEFKEIQLHPAVGKKIVSQVKFLEEVGDIILHHHERWDGKGYPDNLRKKRIPLLSRILSVADSFDAMTSSRPYRSKRSYLEALKELDKNKGTQFDPQIVEYFIKSFNFTSLD